MIGNESNNQLVCNVRKEEEVSKLKLEIDGLKRLIEDLKNAKGKLLF